MWRDTIRSRPATGKLVLVEIDAGSLAALDHWPWPRSYHALAIEALGRAGAQAMGFDVEFSARSTPRQDARSEAHTSDIQSLMRISSDVLCLKKHTLTNDLTIQT